MPSSAAPPSFIRYFAHTDESPAGKAALEYLKSMVRIAPVRLVSSIGGLVGAWHRFENMLLTPMAGTYVNVVATHPSRWVWTSSVPMTSGASDEDGLPAAPRVAMDHDKRELAIEVPDPHKVVEYAERVEELYTDRASRNVLIMLFLPETDLQYRAAKRYQHIVCPSLAQAMGVSEKWPQRSITIEIVPVPVENHATVRGAICGSATVTP